MERTFKAIAAKIVVTCLIAIVILVWAVPIFWMILSSFKSTQAIIEPKLIVWFKPTLANYKFIFETQNFFQYLINSLIVAVCATFICLTTGTLAAYSIARWRTGGNAFANWVIFTKMAPPAILIIPFFLMFKSIGLINTVWALVIANITFNIPFVIWTMRGFFDELPEDMEEAALIDGCTRLEAFWRVSLPLARSGLITTSIFCFLFVWNEYLFGLTLALSEKSKTLPVATGDFITGYSINWGPVFGSGSLILLPAFIMVLFLQRYIVQGLTVGAVK
ncbi:carbohydrate ABC transporter permease [Paenibacillus chondroitinus]|uniref:Carbohydrate ABC transporter permease n=1 Tax=Paenibacillus chondroitinus TaxID=59842 RepID=A0ABU6DCY1_9BACL|nr:MULTISPECIES: carbohydrate ABC transporter permease [Paenibacillus]MCY9662968.1 carbohydrate ABC transporter permease [Paenibacillus anseongense]MEB4795589.1 carbohydrate ABC transporter permease [Paenibacillus chondroitinus]